jgi:hypothetical protein
LNINNFHTTKSQQRKNNLLTLAISPAVVVPAPLSQSKEKNTEKKIEVTRISVHSVRTLTSKLESRFVLLQSELHKLNLVETMWAVVTARARTEACNTRT